MNRDIFLTQPPHRQRPRACIPSLTDRQINRLIERYEAGATVYELAAEFRVERRTVAVQLRRHGVTLRRQSPTAAEIDEMLRLYQSGQSLEAVGQRLGFVARTVQRYLEVRGVERRDTHGRLPS